MATRKVQIAMVELKLQDYISHLNSIHRKLIFFLDSINQGNHDLIVDLALKLRILYINKSGTKPLFSTIEHFLNVKIKVWVRETFEEEMKRKGLEDLIGSITFGYFNEIDFWLEKGTYKVGIIEAFNRPKSIIIGEHSYSAKEIVEIVADKLGGAHIDHKLDVRTLTPQTRSISFGRLNTSEHIIIQTTIQTIKIIEILFDFINTRKFSEFIEKNTI